MSGQCWPLLLGENYLQKQTVRHVGQTIHTCYVSINSLPIRAQPQYNNQSSSHILAKVLEAASFPTYDRWSSLVAMSWRPFFDLEQLEFLRSQIPDHPQGAGRGGLPCPPSLAQKAIDEYGYTVVDGKTTGNCCVLAFANSTIAQGCRASWKKLNETKRSQSFLQDLKQSYQFKNKAPTLLEDHWGISNLSLVALFLVWQPCFQSAQNSLLTQFFGCQLVFLSSTFFEENTSSSPKFCLLKWSARHVKMVC